MSELLPCPFCAEPPTLDCDSYKNFSVICECGAEFNANPRYPMRDDVIRGWNTRAASPPVGREEIARLINPMWMAPEADVLNNYPGQADKFRDETLAKADAILARLGFCEQREKN